jgi:hypothetical protein
MTPSETNKLFKPIATDFKIIARKTGLISLDYCEDLLHDIKVLMLNDYLTKISIVLDKPVNNPIAAKQYLIGQTNRIRNDRPGNNNWEEQEGERLHVILSESPLWLSKQITEREAFQKQKLKLNWVPSNIDTTFPTLQKQITKQYSTGTNGADRTDFN